MLIKMQTDENTGTLQVNVVNQDNSPVEGAEIIIRDPDDGNNVVQILSTDDSGQTENVELQAPPAAYSLDENSVERPYSEYDIEINAPGYDTERIVGSEILSGVMSIQNVKVNDSRRNESEDIDIGAHTLYGYYPEKISEAETKPLDESGEIVLSRVVVPEYVVVHDGVPSNSSAKDYYVTYKDYIKNVASSEIYATWPTAAIEANILAIMSFTLNRVYTEWYRNKGYNFTITSSTAYDQKWIYGRNIYEPINLAVDNIFDNYLSRPGIKQPILTQYCDGKRVTCPNWLSQWGSCDLAERGYSTIDIIHYYYGNDMYINTAEQISGIPASWPGYDLTIGSSGNKVSQMQDQLDTIAQVYTAIPRLTADGIYGENTRNSVKKFQEIFDLPATGVVDFATWYQISQIYVGITRIAEGISRG